MHLVVECKRRKKLKLELNPDLHPLSASRQLKYCLVLRWMTMMCCSSPTDRSMPSFRTGSSAFSSHKLCKSCWTLTWMYCSDESAYIAT